MILTEREKKIIERATLALYNITARANKGITEHRFEKAAEMLEQILIDCGEAEIDDAQIAMRESVGENWW